MWGWVKLVGRVLAVGIAVLLEDGSAGAQCAVGGASQVAAPAAPHLRSYHASFQAPSRLAVDAAGVVYVADPGRREVIARAASGEVVARVGELGRPLSIAVGVDRRYVGDEESGSVRAFDAAWNPLFALGRGPGEVSRPTDIAVDALSGNVFVVDGPAHRVAVYDGAGEFLRAFGGEGSDAGEFLFPSGIFVDAARREVYVADQLNYRIQVFDVDGGFLSCFGAQGSAPGRFNMPQEVLVDAAGRVYVADAMEGRVQVLDRSGNFIATIGEFGESRGELRIPVGMAIDPSNRLFVAAVNNARLEVYGLDEFSDPDTFVPATVWLRPQVVDRAASGGVALLIEVPGRPIAHLSASSLSINGMVPAPDRVHMGDDDGDGVADLRVELEVATLVGGAADSGAVDVLVSGTLDGAGVAGSAVLRVATCLPTTHCELGDADPQCNEAVCDELLGCVVRAISDGSDCEDGDACTIDDECFEGTCGGERLACDDHNVCTDDSCDSLAGCTYVPNRSPCDDGNPCTASDSCALGECSGAAVECDDNNLCTDDVCDPVTGCLYVANTTRCDDGDACTDDDRCVEGSCAGGTAHDCDDGDVCTDDFCDPRSGCRYEPNAVPCSDGDACTVRDTCGGGRCTGLPLSCDDGNVCTDDRCEAAAGCVHPSSRASCDDGDAGTIDDSCDAAGDCRGRATTGDFAVLVAMDPRRRGGRLAIGRNASIDAAVCADTVLAAVAAQIGGDVVATGNEGYAVALQRGVSISGAVVTGGGAVRVNRGVAVAGRVDDSANGAELAQCAAGVFRAEQRRAEILAAAGSTPLPVATVGEAAVVRFPAAGSLGPGTVLVDATELRIGRRGMLRLVAGNQTEMVVVRVAGKLSVAGDGRIAVENLAPERVLFVTGEAASLGRGARLDGSIFSASRLRTGPGSAVAGQLIASAVDLAPATTIEHRAFLGWAR